MTALCRRLERRKRMLPQPRLQPHQTRVHPQEMQAGRQSWRRDLGLVAPW